MHRRSRDYICPIDAGVRLLPRRASDSEPAADGESIVTSPINLRRLQAHRAASYWLKRPPADVEQAIDFVERRGYLFFWPTKGIEFPSLWTAVAGNRPVPSEHDDPGHVTWGWKDRMLGKRRWYYAKLLRKKATLISLETAPYFYALTENYGEPDQDYLVQYEAGRMKQEAKLVYEAVLKHGPIDTVALRRRSGLASQDSKYRFNRSLTELQVEMKILPVGVAEAGAWNYAFVYDLVPRHLPELPQRARMISERQARQKLLELYFESLGASPRTQLSRMFGWRKPELEDALDRAVAAGRLVRGLKHPKAAGEWLALPALV